LSCAAPPPMSHQVSLHATGAGLSGGNTAEPSSFVIEAPNVKDGELEVVVVGPNGKRVQSTLTNNHNGSFTVVYQTEIEGHHDVQFSVKSTFRVGIAVGTDASKSRAYGPGLEDGVQDNLPTHFTIEARGTDGQPMKKGGDPFDVKISGPQGDVPAKVTDNGDGTYNVEYAPEHAGPHRVDVSLKYKPVDRSPYTVNVREGADHRTSHIEGFQFVIRARTKSGKDMSRGGENFAVKGSGPRGEVPVKLEDRQNGTYNVSYSLPADAPGTYKFQVQVNGKDILGTPYTHDY